MSKLLYFICDRARLSNPTFTPDLIALADWLQACQIGTVAMESTGVYEQFRAREVKNLQRKAAQLGFSLTPQAA